jgi:Ca2+-dependent lipid-binding protein
LREIKKKKRIKDKMPLNTYTSLMRVEVVAARNLKDEDTIGHSDPYVKVKFDSEEQAEPTEQRTPVIEDTGEPVWNHSMYFLVTEECKSVDIVVKDQDVGFDESLGHTTVVRADEGEREERKGGWFALEDGDGGQIEIYLTEIPLQDGLAEVRARSEGLDSPINDDGLQLLEIILHGGEDMRGGGMFGKPDPYAKIIWDVEDEQVVYPIEENLKTETCNSTRDPEWNAVFHYLVSSNVTQFTVKVYDEDVGVDDKLGEVGVVIGELGEEIDSGLACGKGTIRLSHCKVPPGKLFPSE